MPLWPCAHCHKNFEKKDLKRCGQCGVAMYCSRECQKAAWKTCHKTICESDTAYNNMTGPDEVQRSRQEKLLSKWLNEWRGVFEEFTMRALDLANHKGEERTKTHCFVMSIQETGRPDVARAFRLLGAKVVLCSELAETYPALDPLLENPPEVREDLVRVRWAMICWDPERIRQGNLNPACQCRVAWITGIDHCYKLDPEVSRRLADDVPRELKSLLEEGEPDEVRRSYCRW